MEQDETVGRQTCPEGDAQMSEGRSRSGQRRIVVMVHPSRLEAHQMAAQFITEMAAAGVRCSVLEPQRPLLSATTSLQADSWDEDPDTPVEVAVVFGGDGTILWAAEWATPRGVPVLGVNLGHVGFLAELESSEVATLVEAITDGNYQVEERFTLRAEVFDASGALVWESFAINEASIEKSTRERMLQVLAVVDGRPISAWNCDGVLVSTPTGSTAYAFSAGGPVMWPDVQAIELVPLSAHALFNRPLVLSPHSVVELTVAPEQGTGAVLNCDGRRSTDIEPGGRARVTRYGHDLRLVRLGEQPFTTRLVKKFELPVAGWRSSAGHESLHTQVRERDW